MDNTFLDKDYENDAEIESMMADLCKGSFTVKLKRNKNKLHYEVCKSKFWFNGRQTNMEGLVEAGEIEISAAAMNTNYNIVSSVVVHSFEVNLRSKAEQEKYERYLYKNIDFWLRSETLLLRKLERSLWKDVKHLQYSLHTRGYGPGQHLCNHIYAVIIAREDELTKICASYNEKCSGVVRKVTGSATELLAVKLSALNSSDSDIKVQLAEHISAEAIDGKFRKNNVRKVFQRNLLGSVTALEDGELSIPIEVAKLGLRWPALLFQDEPPADYHFLTLRQMYQQKGIPLPDWLLHRDEYCFVALTVEYMDRMQVALPGGRRKLGETESMAIKRIVFEDMGLQLDEQFRMEAFIAHNNNPHTVPVNLTGTYVFVSKQG